MKNFLFKNLIVASLLVGGAMSVSADEIGVDLIKDLGSVEVGQTYSLSAKGDYYTYTPEETGLITVQTDYNGTYGRIGYTNTCFFFLYDVSKLAGPNTYNYMTTQTNPEIVGGGYSLLFNVTGGETYIFGYGAQVETSLSFEVLEGATQEVPATMTFCYPTPGTTFDYGLGTNDFILEFDQTLVSIESIALTYTDKEGEEQSINIPRSDSAGWEISDTKLIVRVAHVNDIFKNAKADADYDFPFYLEMNKVMCGAGPVTSSHLIDGGDEYVTCDAQGNISIEYQFMDSVTLLSYEFPSTIYSYFAPGTPEGIATLEFDGPVRVNSAQMVLWMGYHPIGSEGGNQDEPDPSWNINYSLNEDNTVLTLNFTGVDFGASLMKDYSQATIIITGIYGENGLVADLNNGEGQLQLFPTYVNSPYEGSEVPSFIPGVPTINPANLSTLRELQDITVEWSEAVELVSGVIPEATVQVGIQAPEKVSLSVKDGKMVIALTEITLPQTSEALECVVNVESGLVKTQGGLVNNTFNITYTLAINGSTAIEEINKENKPSEIYNLNGVKMNPDNLKPGIYVIDGKKVIVK